VTYGTKGEIDTDPMCRTTDDDGFVRPLPGRGCDAAFVVIRALATHAIPIPPLRGWNTAA